MIDPTQLYGLSGVPIVIALIELCKRADPTVDPRWWPLLALVTGVVWNLGVAAVLTLPLGPAALVGVVVGLTASGAYSQVVTLRKPAPASKKGGRAQ